MYKEKQTMQTVLEKMHSLTEGYRLWTVNNESYAQAVRNPLFLDEAMYSRFTAVMKGDEPDRFLPELMALLGQRIRYLEHYALLQILQGEAAGWRYFDRACDSAWWAFKGGAFSDRTAGDVPFLLAYCFLTGQRNRTDHLGRFLYRHQENKMAEIILRHNDMARFVVQLWAKSKELPLAELDGFQTFIAHDTPYACLSAGFGDGDNMRIQRALDKALDRHILDAADRNNMMHRSLLSHLFPVEVLFFLRLRAERGLETKTPFGNILWQKFKDMHTLATEEYVDALLAQDEALKRIFGLAVRQGLFLKDEWEFFYRNCN